MLYDRLGLLLIKYSIYLTEDSYGFHSCTCVRGSAWWPPCHADIRQTHSLPNAGYFYGGCPPSGRGSILYRTMYAEGSQVKALLLTASAPQGYFGC